MLRVNPYSAQVESHYTIKLMFLYCYTLQVWQNIKKNDIKATFEHIAVNATGRIKTFVTCVEFLTHLKSKSSNSMLMKTELPVTIVIGSYPYEMRANAFLAYVWFLSDFHWRGSIIQRCEPGPCAMQSIYHLQAPHILNSNKLW